MTISGKISFYKNKYQITNPTHVSTDINKIKKIHSSYSLTEGLSEKKYLTIVNTVLEKLPDLDEWHDKSVLNKFQNISWKESIQKLHDPKNINKKGPFFDRLAFDEIL